MGNKVTMNVIAGVNVDSTGLIVDTSKAGTGARSSIGINSGKVYFEVHATGNIAPGLCDETNNLNSVGYPNYSSFAVQYGFITSTRFYIASTEYSYHTPVNLDLSQKNTIGFALNMDNYFLSIYLNGILAMDSFALAEKITNLGTKLYPFLFTGGENNVSHTEWNFGATPFKYPIPEGYTSYDGNQSNTNKYLLKDDEGYKNLTELVSTEIPTEEQFKDKGMSEIPSYSQLSTFNDLVTYATSNLSKFLVKFKPKAKTVLSSGSINFSGKELKKVSLIGTDNARVLFSKDRGETWCNNTSPEKIPIDRASSTSPYYSSKSPNFAVDGVTNAQEEFWYVYNTAYQPNETGHILVLQLVNLQSMNRFSLYTRGVSGNTGGIKDFELYGSNDGITRELLFSGTNPPIPDKYIHRNTYSLPQSKEYKYFIFNFKGSYYNSNTVIVSEIELYGQVALTSLSAISTQGLTPTQLTAITPDEWKSFMGDSSVLRFAYYLPDETANTDKLELTVDFIGE